MTTKTREEHAMLVDWLYLKLMSDDYHSRLAPDSPSRAGLEYVRHRAREGCMLDDDAERQLMIAQLSGIQYGAAMRIPTPRCQDQVSFIQHCKLITICSAGPDAGTRMQRDQVAALFAAQVAVEEPIPSPHGLVGGPYEGVMVHLGDHAFVAGLDHPADEHLLQVRNGEPVFLPGARVSYSVVRMYGVLRAAKLTQASERERGIIIRTAGEIYVATRKTGFKEWLQISGPVPAGAGGVTFRRGQAADGSQIATGLQLWVYP